MKFRHYRQVDAEQEMPGVTMRTVIGAKEGAPHFAMRVFELQPGMSTPLHNHQWEHEVYIISGQGTVKTAEGEQTINGEDVVYIAPGEQHAFGNIGSGMLRFVCCIPLETK